MVHLSRLAAGMIALAATGAAWPADLPLYVRYLPFAPPNLYLQFDRNPANAFYLPGLNAGIEYRFVQTPASGTTLSLAQGPIPVYLMVFRGAAGCTGSKTVTVSIDYSIGGVVTSIGTQTQTINVAAGGDLVQSFAFNGITAVGSSVLVAGDFVQMRIVSAQTRLCLVNEFPLGGTDADASRAVFQTGPVLTSVKSSEVISDPFNGVANPKTIPGARIRYTTIIANDAGASADGDEVVFADAIPPDTSYVAGSILLDAVPQTDADDPPTDTSDFNVTSPDTVTIRLGVMPPGATHTVTFDVYID